MEPVNFPEANKTFHRPSDMTEEQCQPLRVCTTIHKLDGTVFPVHVSAWRPSPEELGAILDGKPIYLTIFGGGHPPVMLTTKFPE